MNSRDECSIGVLACSDSANFPFPPFSDSLSGIVSRTCTVREATLKHRKRRLDNMICGNDLVVYRLCVVGVAGQLHLSTFSGNLFKEWLYGLANHEDFVFVLLCVRFLTCIFCR